MDCGPFLNQYQFGDHHTNRAPPQILDPTNRDERMMRKPFHLRTPFVLAGFLCLGAAPAAIGCGFHPALEVELENMYPGSLPVAVALRSAADRGVIDASALEAPSKGVDLYADTVHRLQELRKILAASPAAAELPLSFSLGYVESQLWTRFSKSDGEIDVAVHTDGPTAGEAVVLTGEPVLTKVLTGRLTVEHALADGTILIDGNENAKTGIRHALEAMSVTNRISERPINGRLIQATMREK
jgi:hypothetical protein